METEYKTQEETINNTPEEETTKPQYKEVTRFDPKLESKLLIKFQKLNFRQGNMSEDQALNINEFGLMDSSNVLMFIAKTEQAKRFLSKFADFEHKQNIPELRFNDAAAGDVAICKYNSHLLASIIEILNLVNNGRCENIQITLKKDFPIVMDTLDFKVILAPRVGEE